MFYTRATLDVGALLPMPDWVWRDVRFGGFSPIFCVMQLAAVVTTTQRALETANEVRFRRVLQTSL